MKIENKLSNCTALILVFAVSCIACAAQVASHTPTVKTPMNAGPHSMKSSSRVQFAKACGIANPSMGRAITLTRSQGGAWSRVTRATPPSPNDSALVRAWHEQAWAVEVQEADAAGDAMHIADMCFNAQGNVTRIVDKYINMPKCGCMRVTETSFSAGKVVKREQSFYKGDTAEKIATPAGAAAFPAPFEHIRLEQLPFWSLLK